MKRITAAIAAFFMTSLTTCIMLAPALAAPDALLVMPYNENVRIVLSRHPCPDGPGWVGVAQRIDKQFMRGCWTFEPAKNLVRIQWSKGDFSIFDIDKFKPVQFGEEKPEKKDTF